jgi:uncharacterized protein YijF (DUF1287 family)
MKRFLLFFGLFIVLLFNFACRHEPVNEVAPVVSSEKPPVAEIESPAIKAVLESALEQTKITKNYTQNYYVIPYPNGDVPAETGACTDVIIRAFRKAGVDLQKEVHEDMLANFSAYPQKWNLPKTDTNIDHRRVPNLQTYFTRQGKSLPVSVQAATYKPGDVVTWDLDGKGMTHIGLVSNLWNETQRRYLVIHNIGGGTRAEDVLFNWKVTGHFRYF